jgi:hypothetical protein
MGRLMLAAGTVGAAGLVLLSIWLNLQFGRQLGGWQLAAASVLLDLVKISLPAIIALAVTARGHSRYLRGIVIVTASLLWIAGTLYSSQSAAGAVLLSRLGTSTERTGMIEKRRDLSAEHERLVNKNPWTPRLEQWRMQPAASIAAQLEAHKDSWLWDAAQHCDKPTGTRQLAYCQDYHKIESAFAVAATVEADSKRLSEIERELAAMPVHTSADPAAEMIADATGTNPKLVVYTWSGLAAMLMELLPSVLPALLILAAKLSKQPGSCQAAARLAETTPVSLAAPAKAARTPRKYTKKQRDSNVASLAAYRLGRGQPGRRSLAAAKQIPPSCQAATVASAKLPACQATLAAAASLAGAEHTLEAIVGRVAEIYATKVPRNVAGKALLAAGYKRYRRSINNKRDTFYAKPG